MNLIDTDALIEMIKTKKHQPGAISTITLIETLRGIDTEKRSKIKKLLEESFTHLNIDNKTIETYCTLYQKLRTNGSLIPDADMLIASTAIAHNIALQTKDQHFQRLESLGLILAEKSKNL
ncbi:hypothetical protein AC477_02930 [miscellaneous Crenarchaeota group-1 archaeon SG8-32-1]|uniref:PIN domain-containing protein n=1 Tax=miscellaneous Crenarchaeota group-1 archaeon SG8-32-1 TaxID=1685124 RepID=A0A0M0BV68_9ARCH|nr:MAG: hypothetical protein AC477_02930 [miscellaneous Crenarchaeota group-1 archaeon SG8-32-1]